MIFHFMTEKDTHNYEMYLLIWETNTYKRENNFFFFADYCWKVVLKIENEYQRTEDNYQITLTENDKNRILTALVGQDTPRCLKYFLLNSKNTAVANLKPCDAEFMSDGFLRLTLEKETKHSALIQQSDVETCVYQCFKENNCLDLLLLNTENE